ncbi:hypothetical protein EV714DRAFT_274260 [Schizophyllum commune]
MPAPVCKGQVSYKKTPGVLEFGNGALKFTPKGASAPTVRVPNSDVSTILCSKESSPQVRLKVVLYSGGDGHNFTFTLPHDDAVAEREHFKTELTAVIARNRNAHATSAPISAAPLPVSALAGSSLSAAPSPTSSAPPTPRASQFAPGPIHSRAASIVNGTERASTPVIVGNDPAVDFRIRKKVLLANPDLAALHRELVMTRQITEAEFWEGREHLLHAEASMQSQKRGKSGQLVDPRPQTIDGEAKIVITPQLVHDIFDEYPIVQTAYAENVPDKLSEAQFWKRYFSSKLFHAHQASIRSSATQFVAKEDPIFDKYLEKDDDGLEPRRPRTETVSMLVDLATTSEDHGEAGTTKDITMQAGRQKGAIPLIRKFNDHSERLLNAALGELPKAKRRRLNNAQEEYEAQIELDDLRDEQTSEGITLAMQDRQRYYEGIASQSAVEDTPPIRANPRGLAASIQDWSNSLASLRIVRGPSDAALMSMTQNVMQRLTVKAQKNDFPPDLFRQMASCQTAANEFLRQFWGSLYPRAGDQPAAGNPNPAQRAAKAAKMANFLARTPEKVDALVRQAEEMGADAKRVRVALQPVLNAVERALSVHKARMAAWPGGGGVGAGSRSGTPR